MGLSNYLPNSRLNQPGVCTSSTRPASPYEGQVIYETDTDRVLVWNNSAWVDPSTGRVGRAGLVKIIPTSVSGTGASRDANTGDVTVSSGSTSVTINGIFSSAHQAYRIVVTEATTASTTSLLYQLTSSGTAATTTYYWAGYMVNYTAGFSSVDQRGTNTDSWQGPITTTGNVGTAFDLFDPFESKITTYQGFRNDSRSDGAVMFVGGYHNQTTSYDGLKINTSANITSLTVQIYGYN